MSEKIKQTLFSFRTMRAPQANEDNDLSLINHPSLGDSVFYTAVDNMDEGDQKLDVLNQTAGTFSALTKAAIVAINPQLHDLGNLALKKRKKITASEVAPYASAVPLTAPQAILVWDNLFYQTITQRSTAAREALLKILLGDFMANFYDSAVTDEETQKAANARIVIPSQMIINDDNYFTATTDPAPIPNVPLLEGHLAAAEFQMKAQFAIKALQELKTYKNAFYQTELPRTTRANKAYNKSIATLMENAAADLKRDDLTGELLKKISVTIPEPTFIPAAEVDLEAFADVLSAQSIELVKELGLDSSISFDQVEKGIQQYIDQHQTDTFKQTDFHVEKVSVNGTLLPKNIAPSGQPFSFALKTVKKTNNLHGLLMTIDTGNAAAEVSDVTLTLASGKMDKQSVIQSNKDGVITLNLTPKSDLIVGAGQFDVMLAGVVKFKDGTIAKWSSQQLTLGHMLSGLLNVAFGDTSKGEVFIPSGFGLKRLGIADYCKVEQTLCCYVPGEVSHIENIMAREYKERSTRRLRRSEDTTTVSTSQEREQLTDTTSTTRFDMQQEVSKVLQETRENSQDISAHAGLSGTNGIGTFDISGDFAANFASSTSQEESESMAVTQAQEITSRALDRVVSKVSEERINKIIEEFEEQNRHGFDNRQGAEHISGVYRWVDKIYKNEVYNYGRRLQYEFMIPEPASFHIAAKTLISNSGSGIVLKEPIDPREKAFGLLSPIKHAGMITPDNYQQWAAVYSATVAPPPDEVKMVSKAVIRPEAPYPQSRTVMDVIGLPEGYGIRRIFVSALGNGDGNAGDGKKYRRFYISVGCANNQYWTNEQDRILLADCYSVPELDKYTDTIPLAVEFINYDGGSVAAELELIRKPHLLAEWQLDTFNSIIEAYEERLQEYRDAEAEAKAQKTQLMGDNPAYLRRTENTVLKKNCIAYLVGHANMGKNFITGSDAANMHVLINQNMDKYAATVKFIEQAFEWELMDYIFYPFFWGNRAKWGEFYSRDNDDALFRSFLQSGMARTILTVRPGFEEAVLFFMNTGQVWNGGAMPVIGEDLYLTVIKELAKPNHTLAETWESRVPSSLTVIQAKTIALNAEGLPCYCDPDDEPNEEIVQPEVNPLEGLPVFIDGNMTTTSTPGREEGTMEEGDGSGLPEHP